jgi:AbiTii
VADHRARKLLDEIEAASFDSTKPLADALRKCVSLGGRAGSIELREWAAHELSGYEKPEEIPDYRRPHAIIRLEAFLGNYFTGINKVTQQISPLQLPEPANKIVSEEVALAGGIAEIESFLAKARQNEGTIMLTVPHAAEIIAMMNAKSDASLQQITAVYWEMSEPALVGVLDKIRTILAELVAEIRAGLPDDDATPSAELATQAVNVAAYGKARVNVNTQSATGPHPVQTINAPERRSRWKAAGAFVVGLATVGALIVGIMAWQGWGL